MVDQGRRVRGLVHKNRVGPKGLEIELVPADVCDPSSLRRAFDGAQVIYHLAARISLQQDNWPEVEAVNVTGTRNVVAACLDCGVQRLVHFSSIHAIEQEPLSSPLDETRPLATSDEHLPYDRSKALGELEVMLGMEQGLDAVIISPTALVGPYDYGPSYIGQALISLVRGRIPALVSGGFDWVDVRDVVAGALQAERVAESGSRYLFSGHWHSVRELADLVGRLTGSHSPWITVPLSLAYRAAPLMSLLARLNGKQPVYNRASLRALRGHRRISHARATRDLGYHPRPFEVTIADTLDWFAQNGYLDLQTS
jgi:dihydroflavonol-4-reductase